MKDQVNRIIERLTGRNYYYNQIILENRIKRFLNNRIENKFLFILSPPFCGSTLLNEIISLSDAVSVNHRKGTREGQKLPIIREITFDDPRKWDPSYEYNWAFIKKEWMKYWDTTKPVLLEKSPPNIVRPMQIVDNFQPAYFIIFYRNPYAHCESFMRINDTPPKGAAGFAVKCLEYQKKNIQTLSNKLVLSYENLTNHPNQTLATLKNFLPDLEDIDIEKKKFKAHNFMKKDLEIMNLNRRKISKLKKKDIEQINIVFQKNEGLLSFFNYKIIQP